MKVEPSAAAGKLANALPQSIKLLRIPDETWLPCLPTIWRRSTCGLSPSPLQPKYQEHVLKAVFLRFVNDNHQEFVWDPKEPEEGAGDGAIANHRQPFS